MTTRIRRGPRRRESNRVSYRLAAIRGNGAVHVGAVPTHILG